MQLSAPTALVPSHCREKAEQLVTEVHESASLWLVAGRQPYMPLHAADMAIADEISRKLRHPRIETLRDAQRLPAPVDQLSDVRWTSPIVVRSYSQRDVTERRRRKVSVSSVLHVSGIVDAPTGSSVWSPSNRELALRPEIRRTRHSNPLADRNRIETGPSVSIRQKDTMTDRASQKESAARTHGDNRLVADDVAVIHAPTRITIADAISITTNQVLHFNQAGICKNPSVSGHAGPTFVSDFSLSLRREVISLFPHQRKDLPFPALQRGVLEQELQHVALRALGELLLRRALVLQLLALLVEELAGVDEPLHVLAVGLEAAHLDGLVLFVLVLRAPLEVLRVLVDEVLQGERAVDERLHRLQPHLVDDAAHARGVVRHLVHHLAVGVAEAEVVLEEVDVPEDVGHDQLLVHVHVRLEQVRVRGVVVDHHLVDLRQPVLVALGELLVLHPEAPVRVPVGEAAVGGHHVDLVVPEHLEDGLVEVEAEAARVALDLLLEVREARRKLRGAALVHASSPSRGSP